MSAPHIIFFGTPGFAVASLDALVAAGFTVSAVVTAPDKPAGRGSQLKMSAVKTRAVQLGIPVLQPDDLRDPAFLDQMDRIAASIYMVVAFRKLPKEVYQRPKLGCVNLHASLLPDYRGAAPINWAVINGETRTGVTTFFIQERIDTGDMILQEATAIDPEGSAGDLHDRLMTLGADLLVRTARSIFDGTARAIRQPDLPGSHGAPKLSTAMARIDWSRPLQQVHDHIRGFSPHPGAWTRWAQESGRHILLKILRSRILADLGTSAVPGEVTIHKGRLTVTCAGGRLRSSTFSLKAAAG